MGRGGRPDKEDWTRPSSPGGEDGIVEPSETEAPRFYDFRDVCPDLQLLRDHARELIEEMTAATGWNDWPEQNLYRVDEGHEWKVYPFCYTFPSGDPTKRQWVDRNCMQCPRTVELLRSIPAVRTALYSRMSPGTHLTPHQGWAELANSVLRAHIALAVPEPDVSGVAVEGEERVHSQGDILMFDDSKVHLGFNRGATHRCVLIVDVERPPDVPLGRAGGGRTEALEAFISYFAHGGDAAALQQAMDRSLADAHWMHGDDSSSEGSGGEDGGESDAARTDTA